MQKKLGFGLARLPLMDINDDSKIDIKLSKKMEIGRASCRESV